MPTITFDGPNKLITIGYDAAITTVDAITIYSAWKNWVLAGNAQYFPAFLDSVGGNALGGGVYLSGYYFLNNTDGWRLTHEEYDYQINMVGDFYPSDPTQQFIVTTPTPHAVTFVFQRSAASYLNTGNVSGINPPTASEIAVAVWNRDSSSYTGSSSMGDLLKTLNTLHETSPEIADAVWAHLSAGHNGQTTMGDALRLLTKLARNKVVTDPLTGTYKVYDDNNTTILLQGNLYRDVDGTTPYSGAGADRRDRLV